MVTVPLNTTIQLLDCFLVILVLNLTVGATAKFLYYSSKQSTPLNYMTIKINQQLRQQPVKTKTKHNSRILLTILQHKAGN